MRGVGVLPARQPRRPCGRAGRRPGPGQALLRAAHGGQAVRVQPGDRQFQQQCVRLRDQHGGVQVRRAPLARALPVQLVAAAQHPGADAAPARRPGVRGLPERGRGLLLRRREVGEPHAGAVRAGVRAARGHVRGPHEPQLLHRAPQLLPGVPDAGPHAGAGRAHGPLHAHHAAPMPGGRAAGVQGREVDHGPAAARRVRGERRGQPAGVDQRPLQERGAPRRAERPGAAPVAGLLLRACAGRRHRGSRRDRARGRGPALQELHVGRVPGLPEAAQLREGQARALGRPVRPVTRPP